MLLSRMDCKRHAPPGRTICRPLPSIVLLDDVDLGGPDYSGNSAVYVEPSDGVAYAETYCVPV